MSHQWKFNVSWKHTCLTCGHPLDVSIAISSYNEYDLFWRRHENFTKLRPYDIDLNKRMYKIINMKAHRMCKSCYDAKAHNVSFNSIMNREITGKKLYPTSKSMSAGQIYDWFESFNRYVHRPDADNYIVGNDVLVG